MDKEYGGIGGIMDGTLKYTGMSKPIQRRSP